MSIDWKQVLTHIGGFIIAVLILRRYAWGPILAMLDERRERIRQEFERIDTEKQGAAALKAEYDAQLRNIEAQARLRLQEAVQEGQKVAGEIREQARQDAHAQIERAREEIERERDKAAATLRNDMVDMVVNATGRLLQEQLDEKKQRALVASFIGSLDTVKPEGGGRA